MSICHIPDFQKCGLVTERHNKIHDGVVDLDGKFFTSTHVRDDPLIFVDRSAKRPKELLAGSILPPSKKKSVSTEQKGDLLIHTLYQNETDCVHNMPFLNTDAKSNLAKTPEKFLQEAERTKINMYLEACIHQSLHFLLFVATVDAILVVEVGDTLKRIYSRLVTKLQQPYSKMCGNVNSRVDTTLVWATHEYIQGPRVPVHWINVQIP